MQIKRIVTGELREICYLLISNSGHAAIIDPGADPQLIIQRLESSTPTMILLTHGHYDHIGAVDALKARYEGIKVYIGAQDADFLADPQKNMSRKNNLIVSCAAADVLLEDGDSIDFDGSDIKVITTPGHTMGSVCYLVADCLFSGDTLFNGATGRTDLYGGDSVKLQESLQKLKKLNKDTVVYPGHGLKTTLKNEQ
ncbi:MAG: MBL fold metallo-hydrolase [Oscillospiraceae bacterium]|nr:MBL fold metallo-hydrolase [Oscillospiraceae bacterium]